MTDSLPIFYSFRRCPYAMRARLALKSSGMQVFLREITLKNKPDHMVSISPKATVPVLQLANKHVLDESLDIMHWAFDQRDPESMRPRDKSFYNDLAASLETDFKTHLDRFKYHTRYENVDPDYHYEQAYVFLDKLTKMINSDGWIDGDHISMADLAVAPFIRQFSNADPHWRHKAHPDLQKWLTQFVESERFLAIMHKFDPWLDTQETVIF